jgi:hypothetical protein
MLSNDFECDVTMDGVKLHVEMEPGCWIRGNILGIMVGANGIAHAVYRSKRDYYKATDADLKKLLKRIELIRCSVPGCKQRLLVGDETRENNPKLLCQQHRLKVIHEGAAKERAKEDAEKAGDDAKAKANGFRYKSHVWIHRDDRDDFYVRDYHRKKPTRAELDRIAKKRRSRLLGDYEIVKL